MPLVCRRHIEQQGFGAREAEQGGQLEARRQQGIGGQVAHASQQMLTSQHQAMMTSAVDMLKSSGARVV